MHQTIATQEHFPATKPKLWTQNFIFICLANLTMCISFHSLLPTLPVYIETQGGSKEIVGLALAFLTAAAVIIRPVAGWTLDRFGRKWLLLFGLFIFLLPNIAYIFMVPIISLLFLRLCQGFGWGICSTSIGTVVSDVIPNTRLGEGLGFFGSTTSISLALAPAIALWMIDKLSFPTLFIICSLFTAASILFALAIKYPKLVSTQSTGKLVFIERPALMPSFIMLLVTLTYSSLLSFLALHMRQSGITATGLFFTAMALTTLASRPLAGVLIDNKGQQGYNLVVFSGLMSAAAAMLVAAHTADLSHLILSGLLYGVGFGFLQPSMLALCLSSVPSTRKGAANATYWTAFDIGVAVGSVLWGYTAERWGYPIMFQLNLFPLICAFAIYIYNTRKSPHNNL